MRHTRGAILNKARTASRFILRRVCSAFAIDEIQSSSASVDVAKSSLQGSILEV